jgi:hypothetical protein
MWLQRVLFNVRYRLLSQQSRPSTEARPSETAVPQTEERRAQVIVNQIMDLDERCEKLQAR